MPNNPTLTVCLDANVIISAFRFGGIPDKIMIPILDGSINHVTSHHILEEVRQNLITKLGADGPEIPGHP